MNTELLFAVANKCAIEKKYKEAFEIYSYLCRKNDDKLKSILCHFEFNRDWVMGFVDKNDADFINKKKIGDAGRDVRQIVESKVGNSGALLKNGAFDSLKINNEIKVAPRVENKKNNNSLPNRIKMTRRRIMTFGFSDEPIREFESILKSKADPLAVVLAARELSLLEMRKKTDAGYRSALKYIKIAFSDGGNKSLCEKLITLELFCWYFLGKLSEGRNTFRRAEKNNQVSVDSMLVFGNFQDSEDDRCASINKVLNKFSIPKISLLSPFGELSCYDRLCCVNNLQSIKTGPKVTVLVAAYDAAHMISTTLRSLQEQTWNNLEIIVIDDCSQDNTCAVVESFAASDSRIRLIRLKENGGAYVARNRGLDEATGSYVTIHDADDWSHPIKIQTQVRYLEENPHVIGCTTQQARARSDLTFQRWSGDGTVLFTNTSSFMFRKDPVREKCGYWDTVRFAADNELIRRIQKIFGKEAVVHIPSGPLSFQRDSDSSIVAHEHYGINGFPKGIRHEYLEAQLLHHETAHSLKYSNIIGARPFAVPVSMLPNRAAYLSKTRHFDVIIASDFRMHGGSTASNVQEIKAQKKNGIRTALFQMYRYDFDPRPERMMLPEVRKEIDGESVQVLAYGEEVSCDVLILRYPPILYHRQIHLPKINAKTIKVIVNQPPMSDYTENGVLRYKIEQCAENVRTYFGKDAEWCPIGPQVREALNCHHAEDLRYICLSKKDWHNIIDVSAWNRGLRNRGPQDTLRIGRHSRDHLVKWPSTKVDVLAAYPDSDDVEVHVLGGASTVEALIGYIPDNWVVCPYGSKHPKDFLSDIDVFIYFAHPDWVESFGRTIIEAMAVGVPVILPEIYRPLFKDAALYATPKTAIKLAKELHENPDKYDAQVKKALKYASEQFGYEMHVLRLKEAGANVGRHLSISTNNSEKKYGKIPSAAGKTSLDKLEKLPKRLFTGRLDSPRKAAVYNFSRDGFRFDFLWQPKPEAKRIFVLFSGDAKRSVNDPPVFQRWSWAQHFPGHCLYISDPSLYLSKNLGLGWYAGTSQYDIMPKIAHLISSIAKQIGISEGDVWSYGSSGGGFAALRLSLFMQRIGVVAINPQTVVTNYERKNVETYLRWCFERRSREQALKDFPERLSLLSNVDKLKMSRIIYIQNILDTHHYKEHYFPFCGAMGVDPMADGGHSDFRRLIFSHEGGHTKAETPEVFSDALNIIESYSKN